MIVLKGNPRDLGDGFNVNRVLPDAKRRMVGPFVFFDYFGPVTFPPGKGLDVRPHPHIGLATLTYLFEGSQVHRDSLGTDIEILPGDVNWMTAGRGIVHSERTGIETRTKGHTMHGIQSWIGLPIADEETMPSFQNAKAKDLPSISRNGVSATLIVGSAFGLTSPIKVFSPIFYCDIQMEPGATLAVPNEHEERAIFVVDGEIEIAGAAFGKSTMLTLDKDEPANLKASGKARLMLLGGSAIGPRHLWWNFVSSDKARIERAKDEWRAQKMGKIEGDLEFIPLPE
jgi:redox-sensitive bicupin YhaK (pirin superfamily)